MVIFVKALFEPPDIMFGIGGDEWKEYNRGNDINRVCISELIRDKRCFILSLFEIYLISFALFVIIED